MDWKKILNPFRKPPQISIVKPHGKISREVKDRDIKRVVKVANIMAVFCHNIVMKGFAKDVFALSHPQVESEDPLRFFIINPMSKLIREDVDKTIGKFVIINPKIVRHTQIKVSKPEGCVSFLGMDNVEVARYNKIEAEYQVFDVKDMKVSVEKREFILSKPIRKDFSGTLAQIFQHEIDHLDCIYIHKNWKDIKRSYYKI